jgi:2-keto-4-pentenoate hydratase
MKALAACVLLSFGLPIAQAECMTDAQAATLVQQMTAKTLVPTPEGLSEADGACSRAKLNAALEARLGHAIGYKAALTSAAMQKRLGYDKPVWGRLYSSMLLPDGAMVEAAFGARPVFEADLLVRVKSDAVNRARTPMEVLDAIDQVIPFIELPDLAVQTPGKLTGAGFTALNALARLGVAGKPMTVPVTRGERYALHDALRDMTVLLTDGSGKELGRGKGSDVLEHPLNAVIWLAGALAKEGGALKRGDLISLGTFSALLPPKAGLRVTAAYIGLPSAETVSVQFK